MEKNGREGRGRGRERGKRRVRKKNRKGEKNGKERRKVGAEREGVDGKGRGEGEERILGE